MDKYYHMVRMASWAKIVSEANESGMYKTQWCQQQGIKIRQFQYWQKKIRDYILEHPGLSIADLINPEKTVPETVPNGSFYEISPGQQSLLSTGMETSGTTDRLPQVPALVLQVGSLQLYIGDGFNEDTLSSAIRVIRNA